MPAPLACGMQVNTAVHLWLMCCIWSVSPSQGLEGTWPRAGMALIPPRPRRCWWPVLCCLVCVLADSGFAARTALLMSAFLKRTSGMRRFLYVPSGWPIRQACTQRRGRGGADCALPASSSVSHAVKWKVFLFIDPWSWPEMLFF